MRVWNMCYYTMHTEIIHSCCCLVTLYNPMVCSLTVSSVQVILQVRIWEWVAISFSRRSSQILPGTEHGIVSFISRKIFFFFFTTNLLSYPIIHGLQWWLSGKVSACNVGDLGLLLGLGRFPWRRKFQPTPVFLSREFQEQRSLAGYSPWVCKELDMTEWLTYRTYIIAKWLDLVNMHYKYY